MPTVYALLDATFVAFSSFAAGVAGRHRPVVSVLALASPASLVLVFGAALAMPGIPSWPAGLWGVIAGMVGGVGLIVSYRGLALGPVGAVSAGSQCASTILVTAVGTMMVQGISVLRASGLFASVIAILLICRVGRKTTKAGGGFIGPQGPILGVIAGVAFGMFVVLVGMAPRDAGLWVIVFARVTVWAVVAVSVIATRILPTRRTAVAVERPTFTNPGRMPGFGASLLAGLTDGAANVFLALALMGDDLVLVALIGVTAPAITAVLGRAVLKEHLNRGQLVGLVLATVGGTSAVL